MKTLPANYDDGRAKEFARFGQFVAWTTLVAFGFGGVEVLAFVIFGDNRIGAAGGITLGYGGCLLTARELLRRGRMKEAVITSCTGLLVGIVLVAPILPIAIPALTILPLVVVALALPYVQGRDMRLLILASWGAGIFVAALGEVVAQQSGIPVWFSTSFRIGSIVVALGLAFLLMWQFTSRLNDTLAQTRAINIELQKEITERKQAEEKLRKSEELFSKAFHGSPAPMTIARQADGTYIEVNKGFLRMVECDREEVIGHTSLDLNLIDAEGRAEIIRQFREQGDIHNIEVQAKAKSGRRLDVLTSIENIELAGEPCTITTMLDITERKHAEETLHKVQEELELKVLERTASLSEANALLQTMLDYVPDQIYFKDAQSRFIRNSRSQASALRLSDPAQVVGKTDFDFFPHAQRSYDEEQEIIRSGNPLVDLEEWVVWPDGREMWVSTTKVPLRDKEGKIIGTFGISRDITGRKRAEQAIRQLNADLEIQADQLKAANKELEAFSYSVSHDLRAPLRAIHGYTRILMEDYEPVLDAEGKRVCGVISREAQRMGQLIDDLLAFSRLGRKEMRTSGIDMESLADSVFEELMNNENEERIDFRVGHLPLITGDTVMMRQVWVNLISNALKFTSAKERAVIEVGSIQGETETVYFVRDNGAGFDMEYAHKLFGVFQRLHSESEFEGTGVGLAIAQRVIHRHGGRVWAEGEVDKGAIFCFTLPKKENENDRTE